jgi:hypothetical protein
MGNRASACDLTDPTCVVNEVEQTAQDTVDNVQEEANETIDEVQETADETVKDVEETVGEVVNPGNGGTDPVPNNPPSEPTVPGNSGGPADGPAKRPADKGPSTPNAGSDSREKARGPLRPARTLLSPMAIGGASFLRNPFGSDNADSPSDPGLAESAIDAAKDFAFPLLLTIIVGAFLTVQHRVDRRDPKLVFAPIDNDLLSFE